MDYERYCNEKFGKVLETNRPFSLQLSTSPEEEANALTRELWKDAYTHESFFLQTQSTVDGENKGEEDQLLSGFDLLGSTQRQATFLWQVSGERFDDDSFLADGVANYYNFLKLTQRARSLKVILVPTYQIDLMWHTHILTSIEKYNQDCEKIMGSTFHHDDSLTDRSEGSVLNTSFSKTKELWRTAYGTEYIIPGGMYRGEPPVEYFSKKFNNWNAHEPGANQHLVGLFGASSTSPSITKWAPVDGLTSEGLQAFVPTNTTTRVQLKSMDKKENYVLGKTNNGTGYFHLETVDAHEIMLKRVQRQIQKLESDIACGHACCFYSASKMTSKEQELRNLMELKGVIQARVNSPKPNGRPSSDATTTNRDTDYYDGTGVWLYPPFIWDGCGGACGGKLLTVSRFGDASSTPCVSPTN